MSILLADDDIDDCAFFEEALEDFPVAISFRAVHNGEQLMTLLTNAANNLPDVVFY